ncbi:protein kinase [Streptomyces sp. H10-C2]|uniref:protein kinase domain-containing protein n=1 Tax=unclassified Streptomyces TaxID=2593676 RepID=UPI0024B8CB77|nr:MULTISPECIES: protein kinase [unclassified Streptomyces]MDJ0340290.1 protein kinase [Streptomyces sp. PH10-H1]MDJ0368262.1 protein kinase [Streptomyces sp. H10-C2]
MVDPHETTAGTGASDSPELWGAQGLVGDGRYRLTYRLGRGGMAEVFAAEDVRLGRIVAIKLLRSDLAEDPVSKARFTREAQSVAGLNHHAVVAVYDSGEDRTPTGTVPYIVMELVDGHTIRDLLTGAEAPPIDQALIIISGVLEALAYSHQHGIVHRDIKPANVIITNTGAVKVMDFGIARALHGAASTMTQTGMVMGTPQYLSPEQALGKAVDYRSDLYATGCMLYELLALRPPFMGETPLSVVYQHVQDEPQVPSTVSDRVPPELDGLVLRALAKHPDDRFQSAEEMRGVVQYALRMLQEQGGWTNMWDTGVVSHTAPIPSQTGAGLGMGPGTGGGRPGNSTTAELNRPMLLGASGRGADDTHGYDERRHGGGQDNKWLKPVLFVLAAVLAISMGVYFAIGHPGQKKDPSQNVAPSTSQSASAQSTEPSQDTSTDPGQGGGNTSEAPSRTPSRTPSHTPSRTPSGTPSNTPSDTPSDTPSGTPSSSAPTPTTPTTPPSGTPSGGGTAKPGH